MMRKKLFLEKPFFICNERRRGFTLIELLVAFSILSIISGIGFVSFTSYSTRQIVYQAAEEFKESLNIAKFNAVSNVNEECSQNQTLDYYSLNLCLEDSPQGIRDSCLASTPQIEDNKGYVTRVSCGDSESDISSYKFPDGVTFSTFEVEPSRCEVIKYNAVSSLVEGGDCQIKIEGFNHSITLTIDSKGNLTIN